MEGSPLDAQQGESTTVTGELGAYSVPGTVRWSQVRLLLDNHTYQVKGTPSDWMVLVTSTAPMPVGTTVAVDGDVLLRIQHPEQAWRTLLVLRGAEARPTILV